jgi:hypothetical protein
MRRAMKRGVLPIALLTLVVAGCGGGTDSKQPVRTETPVPTPTLEARSAQLLGLLAQGLRATYRVTYATVSPDGEGGDVYVVFNRPPQTRIDTIAVGSSNATSLIIGGDQTTATIGCSGGPDTWACLSISSLGDSLLKAAGPIGFLSATDFDLFDVVGADNRAVAGQTTQCFELRPREGTGATNTEYCLTADGVPLYTVSSSGTVEATEFSPDVSDEDFLPPAAPTTQ